MLVTEVVAAMMGQDLRMDNSDITVLQSLGKPRFRFKAKQN
ncbi:MAG: hypothetical protein QNJ18_05315 [Xenococcaceae cyanobacterium MO_167.B52]|nr:hypothetical protein [Xenococcaceae cyanobacterium MO_167.B52]